jgi:hypothetical protein
MITAAVDTTLLTTLAGIVAVIAGVAVALDTTRRQRRSLRPLRDNVEKTVKVDAQPNVAVDSSFLLGSAAKGVGQDPLDAAIAGRARGSGKLADVLRSLTTSDIYALGRVESDASATGADAKSDLLQFAVEADGKPRFIMPVFTQPEILRQALLRNPDWQTQSVLEMSGSDLLPAIGDDVTVIINPWSDLEYEIPPKGTPPDTERPSPSDTKL